MKRKTSASENTDYNEDPRKMVTGSKVNNNYRYLTPTEFALYEIWSNAPSEICLMVGIYLDPELICKYLIGNVIWAVHKISKNVIAFEMTDNYLLFDVYRMSPLGILGKKHDAKHAQNEWFFTDCFQFWNILDDSLIELEDFNYDYAVRTYIQMKYVIIENEDCYLIASVNTLGWIGYIAENEYNGELPSDCKELITPFKLENFDYLVHEDPKYAHRLCLYSKEEIYIADMISMTWLLNIGRFTGNLKVIFFDSHEIICVVIRRDELDLIKFTIEGTIILNKVTKISNLPYTFIDRLMMHYQGLNGPIFFNIIDIRTGSISSTKKIESRGMTMLVDSARYLIFRDGRFIYLNDMHTIEIKGDFYFLSRILEYLVFTDSCGHVYFFSDILSFAKN